jgi:hypothetical protein
MRVRVSSAPTTAGAREGELSTFCRRCTALFAWLISHQPAVLFSHNKPATRNQPALLFSQNKPAPVISHQPTEQAARRSHANAIKASSFDEM